MSVGTALRPHTDVDLVGVTAAPNAAFGQGAPFSKRLPFGIAPVDGLSRRRPTHWASGTLTALPTSFQRGPLRRWGSSTAGAVQPASKP